MQRYFIKNQIINNEVQVSSDDLHHMKDVMRYKDGDKVVIIDSDGNNFQAIIKDINSGILDINNKIDINNELDVDITIIYAFPKGDKFELVLKKTCELGVKRIVPIITNRCVVKLDEKRYQKKKERYNKILKEASEQCQRSIIPTLEDLSSLKVVEKYKSDYNLVAYEETSKEGKHGELYETLKKLKKGSSITVVVGSEGGFDKEEVDYLNGLGFKSCSLGKRILRSETAPIYICSVIGFTREIVHDFNKIDE
ncbi:MAG: RsmE family RNA methyltransferase [Thomasclavelia sp.]|nr:RsmE family RNA methyltransferase [Thomasclavelia sp.]